MESMLPADRAALSQKIAAKLDAMTDEDLKDLAKELGVDLMAEEVEDADKTASKALADAVMSEPVVDTDVLTGSRDGLKSFLMKSARDKEMKS